MDYENLICERDGAVLVVRLNRPEKMNSLSLALLARSAPVRGVDPVGHRGARGDAHRPRPRLLCRCGPHGSEQRVGRGASPWGRRSRRACASYFHPVAELWSQLPVPLVVAVNGIAAGAGVSLALLGDVTIAARSASFAVLFTPKLGLAPDMGATQLLPRRIGLARARYLALTGRPVSGEEAERIGLIAECVDDASLETRARALAGQLAAGPTRAQLALRELMEDGASRSLSEQLEREAIAQQALADTRDFREGIAAFREKRTPVFRGS